MRHLLFVFLDGVGIGVPDGARNPFVEAPMPTLRALVGGWPTLAEPLLPRSGLGATLAPADATLGVAGLPQSGTGTTALLTGVNVAALLGHHTGPYPPAEIRPLLRERGLLARAAQRFGPESVAFANAFPPHFFARLDRRSARRTATTQAAMAAGITMRDLSALVAGEALSADITGEWWHRMVPEVPVLSGRGAGQQLAGLALHHRLTVFEYFLTDHLGHRPDMAQAHAMFQTLDEMVAGIVETLDPANSLLVIASDHGNCEDFATSDHTRNPVPLIVWGHEHAAVGNSLGSLLDVAPVLWEWMTAGE